MLQRSNEEINVQLPDNFEKLKFETGACMKLTQQMSDKIQEQLSFLYEVLDATKGKETVLDDELKRIKRGLEVRPTHAKATKNNVFL